MPFHNLRPGLDARGICTVPNLLLLVVWLVLFPSLITLKVGAQRQSPTPTSIAFIKDTWPPDPPTIGVLREGAHLEPIRRGGDVQQGEAVDEQDGFETGQPTRQLVEGTEPDQRGFAHEAPGTAVSERLAARATGLRVPRDHGDDDTEASPQVPGYVKAFFVGWACVLVGVMLYALVVQIREACEDCGSEEPQDGGEGREVDEHARLLGEFQDWPNR